MRRSAGPPYACGVIRIRADLMLRYFFACGVPRYGNSFRVSVWGLRPVGGAWFFVRKAMRGVGDDLRPYRFGRARLRARRHEYVNGLTAVLRLREHIAERDVGQVITVGIDVEAIDCVGMKCVRVGICVEDDHGSVLVGGRLEGVQVAEV